MVLNEEDAALFCFVLISFHLKPELLKDFQFFIHVSWLIIRRERKQLTQKREINENRENTKNGLFRMEY